LASASALLVSADSTPLRRLFAEDVFEAPGVPSIHGGRSRPLNPWGRVHESSETSSADADADENANDATSRIRPRGHSAALTPPAAAFRLRPALQPVNFTVAKY